MPLAVWSVQAALLVVSELCLQVEPAIAILATSMTTAQSHVKRALISWKTVWTVPIGLNAPLAHLACIGMPVKQSALPADRLA